MSNEVRDRMYQQLFGNGRAQPYCSVCWGADWKLRDGDRGAASLGKLNVHDLAALRQLILRVIDDGDVTRHEANWELYMTDFAPDESFINAQRLDFCDAVAKAIVEAATPAVKGRVK